MPKQRVVKIGPGKGPLVLVKPNEQLSLTNVSGGRVSFVGHNKASDMFEHDGMFDVEGVMGYVTAEDVPTSFLAALVAKSSS